MSRAVAHALAIVILLGLFAAAFARSGYDFHWEGVWESRRLFLDGWLVTIGISLAALVLSILIGLVAAVALSSRFAVVEAVARVYVEVVRGTPLLVQLLVGFYVVANAVGLENRYLVGILLLSLFSGASMAEIFRSGLAAIPAGQRDAARAIGLTPWQSLRLVILPQAVRLVLPPVTGQLVALVKDSSLLSVLAVVEFTKVAQDVNSLTYSTLECYLPLAAGYLLITLPLSALSRFLERRFAWEAA